jgi:ketosteroid isomerase-like protein
MLDDVIARYIQSYNARDIDGMLDCVTDDVVFENISNAGGSMRLDGKDMMRQVAELVRKCLLIPPPAADQCRLRRRQGRR